MIAMSMLSDAQEEIERGMQERARQTVNRAKWVIHTYWTAPDALREIHGLATAVVLGTGDALTRLNRIAVLSAP
jgi:hypothetical protein